MRRKMKKTKVKAYATLAGSGRPVKGISHCSFFFHFIEFFWLTEAKIWSGCNPDALVYDFPLPSVSTARL
jgi:hypothetical protein